MLIYNLPRSKHFESILENYLFIQNIRFKANYKRNDDTDL